MVGAPKVDPGKGCIIFQIGARRGGKEEKTNKVSVILIQLLQLASPLHHQMTISIDDRDGNIDDIDEYGDSDHWDCYGKVMMFIGEIDMGLVVTNSDDNDDDCIVERQVDLHLC